MTLLLVPIAAGPIAAVRGEILPLTSCAFSDSDGVIEATAEVLGFETALGTVTTLEGPVFIRTNSKYDTSRDWGDLGPQIRNFWGADSQELTPEDGAASLLGLDAGHGFLNSLDVSAMFATKSGPGGAPGAGNDFLIIEIGGLTSDPAVGNDTIVVTPLDSDGLPISDYQLTITPADWGATGSEIALAGDGVENLNHFHILGVAFDLEDFIGTPAGPPDGVAGLRVENSVDLAVIARNSTIPTSPIEESSAVPIVAATFAADGGPIDDTTMVLDFSTAEQSSIGPLAGPLAVGPGGIYGDVGGDPAPAVANFWGAAGDELTDEDGTESILGIDPSHGLVDAKRVDVFFGYELDPGGAPGPHNDFVVFELGTERYPDARTYPAANNVLELRPLDRHGFPIGDFALTIRERDWGDCRRLFRIKADHIGSRRTFRMVGAAFDLADFSGTGTLTGVAGLRCLGRDDDGIDLAVVAYQTAIPRRRVALPWEIEIKAFTFDQGSRTGSLTWASKAGESYLIEVSPDLSVWKCLEPSFLATGAESVYVETDVPITEKRRFYRVRR